MRVEQIGTLIGFVPRVTVYAIEGDGVTVYIGSTTQPIRHRVRAHVADAMNGSEIPVHAWMRARSFAFDVRFLEDVEASGRVDAEKRWIAAFSGLLNLTDGGPGMSGHSFAGTAHAEGISKRLRKGAHFNCLKCGGQLWRKPRDILKGQNKYCSRICSNARNKP